MIEFRDNVTPLVQKCVSRVILDLRNLKKTTSNGDNQHETLLNTMFLCCLTKIERKKSLMYPNYISCLIADIFKYRIRNYASLPCRIQKNKRKRIVKGFHQIFMLILSFTHCFTDALLFCYIISVPQILQKKPVYVSPVSACVC